MTEENWTKQAVEVPLWLAVAGVTVIAVSLAAAVLHAPEPRDEPSQIERAAKWLTS